MNRESERIPPGRERVASRWPSVRLKVESIVALGYPDEAKAPHPRESLPQAQVHAESYGRAYH